MTLLQFSKKVFFRKLMDWIARLLIVLALGFAFAVFVANALYINRLKKALKEGTCQLSISQAPLSAFFIIDIILAVVAGFLIIMIIFAPLLIKLSSAPVSVKPSAPPLPLNPPPVVPIYQTSRRPVQPLQQPPTVAVPSISTRGVQQALPTASRQPVFNPNQQPSTSLPQLNSVRPGQQPLPTSTRQAFTGSGGQLPAYYPV
jgi:hypothetical protein